MSVKAEQDGSNTTIKITAAYWEDFTNLDESGIYYDIIRAVFTGYQLKFSTSSFQRAINHFNSGKADIMVGVYKHEIPNAHFPIWPLDKDMPVQVFYRKNKTPTSLDVLQQTNQKVGWRAGFGFEQFFPAIQEPYILQDAQTGFRLLQNKRLDFVLDYEHAFQREKWRGISYEQAHIGGVLFLAFQNNEFGKQLAKQYDKMMPKLRANNRLLEIFGDAYYRSGLPEFSN